MAIIFEREKDLEDLLMEHEGFTAASFGCENHVLRRQVNLGAYGIADIVALSSGWEEAGYSFCSIHIIELKNEPLTHAHISQVARYREFFNQFDPRFSDMQIHGHLVGPKTFPKGDDLCFLAQSIDWLTVYEFEFDPMTGLEFKPVRGWKFSKDDEAARLRMWEEIEPGERPLPVVKAANEIPFE